jgi:hypothetical protein
VSAEVVVRDGRESVSGPALVRGEHHLERGFDDAE